MKSHFTRRIFFRLPAPLLALALATASISDATA